MNIFVLHATDFEQNARWHNNRHCVKMVSEQTQMLSTAHRILNGKPEKVIVNGRKKTIWVIPDERNTRLCQASHPYHKCTVWARESLENYWWLFNSTMALMKEYTYRYGRTHQYEAMMQYLIRVPDGIPNGFSTPFAQAMPDEYKIPGDAVAAYHQYYCAAKTHLGEWKNRPIPDWYVPVTATK